MESFGVITMHFLLLMTMSSIFETEAYRNGPPVSLSGVCEDMRPRHDNYVPQNVTPPCNLNFSATCYTPGQPVTVTLSAIGNQTFTGFLIEARQNGVNTASYGQFTPNSDGVNALGCFGQNNNAVGHNNPNEDRWSMKQFNWTSSDSQRGTIQFVATVVFHKREFYVGWNNDLPCCTTSSIGSASAIDHSLFTILTSGVAAVLASQLPGLIQFS
jgi:hypothetical protein